ncbi:hypothetical protein CRE_14651 [Caenorhabditis remanei]|uniref:Nuclear receptor domain-containing protein n=1 Tax=Caenorhabditis remanei TaxID=31234 RepID=E3M9B6_CAERE|nr:hypothetical protein CRE_14651 [Caenorhabditis remanei]
MSSDSSPSLFSNSVNDSENIGPNENLNTVTDTSSLPDCLKNISHGAVLLDLLDPQTLESQTVCKICGGYARGVNYGVLTCDNCRAFFSHYLHRKKELKCRKNNNCVIDKFTSNKCGKCRMEKCLRMGMSYNLKNIRNNSTCKKSALVLAQIHKTCKVCGDVPVGIGYGVLSCGSCRMFFRRHNGTDVHLSCNKEGKCDLRLKFAKCPKCRMRKCLEVGMNTNSFVKRQGNLKVFNLKIEADLAPKYDKAINEISQSFELSCTYKKEDIENLAKSNFDLVRFFIEVRGVRSAAKKLMNPWADTDLDKLDVRDLMRAGWLFINVPDFENHQTGLFVNRLPSIDSFEISDKAILFKRSSFLMFILRNITKFSSDGFMLPSKRHIPFRTMKTVYGDLMNEIILVSSDFKSMQLNHQELSLFTAFIFLRPITRGSQDWQIFIGDSTLKGVRDYYRTLLYQLMTERENTQKIISDLATMTLKLYDLTHNIQFEASYLCCINISDKIHNETISFLQTNSKFMNLPPFLCEVYDILKQGAKDANLDSEIPKDVCHDVTESPITPQASLIQPEKVVNSLVQNVVKLKSNKRGNKPNQARISYQHLYRSANSKNIRKAAELKVPDDSSDFSDQPEVIKLSNPAASQQQVTETNMESIDQIEEEMTLDYICDDLIPHFDEMDYSKYLELDPGVWYSGIVNEFSLGEDEGMETRGATPENIL